MTPAPENATPIPAEVLRLAKLAIADLIDTNSPAAALNIVARAIMRDRGDREARPSLPDSREERIREDERDRLLERARNEHGITAMWLVEEGAMLPADRARARQGGNNG